MRQYKYNQRWLELENITTVFKTRATSVCLLLHLIPPLRKRDLTNHHSNHNPTMNSTSTVTKSLSTDLEI
jgi:hypothetical protein